MSQIRAHITEFLLYVRHRYSLCKNLSSYFAYTFAYIISFNSYNYCTKVNSIFLSVSVNKKTETLVGSFQIHPVIINGIVTQDYVFTAYHSTSFSEYYPLMEYNSPQFFSIK